MSVSFFLAGNLSKDIEYSELSREIREKRNPETKELLLSVGNVGIHIFSVDFLERRGRLPKGLTYLDAEPMRRAEAVWQQEVDSGSAVGVP